MRVKVTNKLPYLREFQYYGINQFILLDCYDSVTVVDVRTENEIVYYLSLSPQDFEVCFQDDNGKCICEEVKIRHPQCPYCWSIGCHRNSRGMSKSSSEIMQEVEQESYVTPAI